MKRAWLPILSAAAMAWAAIPAFAQMVVSAKSGVVNYTEGEVLLNGRVVESSITKYPEMKENAVLRTEAGRVEVLLTPGVILRMGENTTLKLITNRLVDTRVEIQSGSAVVEAVQTAKDNNVTVVVKDGAAAISKAGIYRFDTEPAQMKVFRGEAVVEIEGQTIPVGTGRMLMLDGSHVAVEKFNTEETDALDHWSKQRGQLLAMANPSTAKSLVGGGYGYGSGFVGMGGTGCSPYWGFNTWYAMYTYVPCSGYFMSPYGFSYWSPITVSRFYSNPPVNSGRGSSSTAARYTTQGAALGRFSPSVSSRSTSMGSMGSARTGSSAGSAAGAAGHSSSGGGGSHGH